MLVSTSEPISKAELARQLGVSRTYITLLATGRRQPSSQLVDRIRQLKLTTQLPPEMESMYAKWGIRDLDMYKILSLARLPIQAPHTHVVVTNHESCTASPNLTPELINLFLGSRRQGLSKLTRGFYYSCLSKAIGMELSAKGINEFLTGLECKNGKHSYFRTLRVLCNWMVRNGMMKENPIMNVDPPKVQ